MASAVSTTPPLAPRRARLSSGPSPPAIGTVLLLAPHPIALWPGQVLCPGPGRGQRPLPLTVCVAVALPAPTPPSITIPVFRPTLRS